MYEHVMCVYVYTVVQPYGGLVLLGPKHVRSFASPLARTFPLHTHMPTTTTTTLIKTQHTQHFGKGLRAVPNAAVNDGLMDLCFVKAGAQGRGEMLAVLQQMPDGGHMNNPNIQQQQVRSCTLRFGEPGVWNLDGEILKHDGTVVLECKKRLLSVLADPSGIAGSMV